MTPLPDEHALLGLLDDPVVVIGAGSGGAESGPLLNAAAHRMFGRVESHAGFAACFEDGAARIDRLQAQARRSSGSVPGGLVHLGKDGSLRLQCRVKRLRGSDEGFAFVFRERMTERFRALSTKVRELESEVGVRRRAERELKIALGRNETLLTELRHRVKNNLATMQALLNHERRLSDDPAVVRFIHDTSGRLNALFAAQQHIFTLETEADIPASVLASMVIGTLDGGSEGPVFDLKVGNDFPVRGDEANAFSLLLNELLSINLRQAGPGGASRIEVTVTREGGARLLLAGRNGSRVSAEDGDGLTSRIVAGLVRQLGGTIERQDALEACVLVRIPALCG